MDHGYHSWVEVLLGILHGIFLCYENYVWRGGFLVKSNSDFLDLVSKIQCVFSNRILTSTSSRQPRTIAVINNTLGISWTTLNNN